MLKNAYLLAKIGADTAEKGQHFAKKIPKNLATTEYPTQEVYQLKGEDFIELVGSLEDEFKDLRAQAYVRATKPAVPGGRRGDRPL